MASGGKKFKDIYDAGVKTLSDIEARSIAEMQTAKDNHSKVHKESAQQSLKQLEDRSTLLQGELKQSINESLKKLENTLSLENSQSQVFVSSLVAELRTLTEQMKLKLQALKQSHHENVDFARTVASEHYLTNSEDLTFELEQNLSQAINSIGMQSKSNLDSLQQDLEKLLVRIYKDVDEISESNLVLSRDEVETIEDHAFSLLKSFAGDGQNRLKGLEATARNVSQEVESSARNLLETIANQANIVEKQINQNYDQITGTHYQNADLRLSNCADELSALHDTTTEESINLTEQLSADLLSRSTQVQKGLQTRCDDVVKQVESSFKGFKTKLDDRLQYSRGQKQALEADKNKLLISVQSELVSIQKAFAKKIASVLDQSKTDLADVTTSIEKQMVVAIESFDLQMLSSAQGIQKQINDEVEKFLQELSCARGDAINEIANAAKGNMPTSRSGQARSGDAPISEEPIPSQDGSATLSSIQFEVDSKLNGDVLSEETEHNDSLMPDESQTQSQSSIEDLSENKPRRNRRRKDNRE